MNQQHTPSPPDVPGYRIGALAGSGGTGDVWRAVSDATGADVAVKVLLADSIEEVAAAKAEFAVLRSLRHPGLVAMHDIGTLADGRAFLVMDWVEGIPIQASHIRNGGGEVDAASFAGMLLEITSALGYIHGRGVVHADLKPSNILVTQSGHAGSVRLMDFGLAHRGTGAQRDGLAGTIEYMAPELIRGGAPTPQSDLYALGCILYELATGSVPFPGDSALEVLRRHLREEAEPVERQARVPGDVARIIATLMHKQPQLRYRTCTELFHECAALLGEARTPDFEQWQQPPQLPDIPRTRELAKALEVCDLADAGPQLLAIEGPEGMGKSTLLRLIHTELQLRDTACAWLACSGERSGLAPLADLLRTCLSAESAVDDGTKGVVAGVFPELFPGVAPASDNGLDPDARTLRLFHACARILTEHTARRAFLMDDVHLASDALRDFIEYFIAWLDANDVRGRVVIVTTESGADTWAPRGVARRTALVLAALTSAQTTDVLRALFGDQVSSSFASVLHRQSAGVPGRIEEMLAFCLTEGILESSPHGWIIHEKENLGSWFPKSLGAGFAHQIARLDDDSLSILRAVAASPVRVSEGLLAEVTGIDAAELRLRLARLESAGLIDRDGTSVLPLHAALQSALQETSSGSVSPETGLHDAYAAWYARTGSATPSVLAHHLLHGSTPDRALPLLLDAAAGHERTFDFAAAEAALTRALPLTQDASRSEERYTVLVRLAEACDVLGRRDVQEECIDELLVVASASASPAKMGHVYRQQARFLLATSRFDRARKASERALASFARAHDRIEEAQCYRDMGVAEYRMQPGPGVITLYEKARDIFREEQAAVEEGNVLVDIGLVYYSVLEDPQRALACFDEAREIFERAASARGLARAHGNTGAQYFQLGRYEDALAAHARANDFARRIGDRRLIAISVGAVGQCELALCRFSPALLHLQEELRIARELRDEWLEELCLENIGELYQLLGDYEASIASYERTSALAAESGNRVGTISADVDIAGALIARGEIEAAIKRLNNARTALEDVQDINVSAMLLYRTGILHLAKGPHHDPAAALAAFRELGDIADRHGFAAFQVIARSYAGFCQAVLGRVPDALALTNAAIGMLDDIHHIRGGSQDILYNHSVILKANRDTAEAGDFIRRAYDVLMRNVESISDTRLSRSYLEQVRLHADIVREYALAHRGDSKDALAAVKDQNLRILYTVSRKINSTLDLPQLLDTIMDSALEAMNAERGMMFLIEDDQLVLKVSRNVEKETIQDATEISLSILRDVISRGHPVIVSDTAQDEAFKNRDSVVNFRIHSLICVPMISKETLIGTVYVDSRSDALKAMSFSDIEAEFLEAFANLATIAIENARLHARLQAENLYLRKEVERRFGFENIIGASAPMEKLFTETSAAISNENPVLIYGESGTGKELIARAIHYNGARKSGRFVAVDCGALPDTLLESELFGYKRGAFTGAYADKQGLFEEAHNGTLFLDEISNTSLAFQAKLLRVLQEGEYRRVGDTATRVANVRIICATNRNLQEEIAQNRFRQDLFYRLNVIPITVPALRDRASDIPLLVDHFIQEHAAKHGARVHGASRELMDYLAALPWQGNVRELENLIQRLLSAASESVLTTRDLPDDYVRDTATTPGGDMPVLLRGPHRLTALVDVEREHIRYVLQQTGGNKSEAAKILGLKRTTLVERMKKLGMM